MLNSNEADISSYVLKFLFDLFNSDALRRDFFNVKISDVVRERNEGIVGLLLFLNNLSRLGKSGDVLEKLERRYYRKNDNFYRKVFDIE